MPDVTTVKRKWSTIPAIPGSTPLGRIGHTFCSNSDGTRAYLYGGVRDTVNNVSNYIDDFWEYDLMTKKWVQKPLTGDLQCPRAFHTGVWYISEMFIFGGCNGHGRFNKLFSINAEGKCTQYLCEGETPTTRYCHSAVEFEGCMYIYGGKCGGRNSNKRLSDLFKCKLNNTRWIECDQIGEKPPPRSAHSALTHGRTMMVFGGRSAEGKCCEDFYMYHYDTHVWRKISSTQSIPFGRARHSAIVHYGNVIVFGGWNGKRKLSDLFVYNVEASTFELDYDVDNKSPSRRECHLAVVCKNTMVVFGGRFRGNYMEDTIELYLGPKTATDTLRDWLIEAGKCDNDDHSLPLRLFESCKIHDLFWSKLSYTEPATQPN